MYSFIHKSAAVWFFEYAANSSGEERLRRKGKTLRSRGETGDIILLHESQTSCYVLCLKKEAVNTGSCARMCVCVCVLRTPHGGLSDTSALEIRSGGGYGLNSVLVRTGVRI